MSALGEARIRALSFLATRGRVRNLRVYPQTIVKIDNSSSLDISGSLRLGPHGLVGRYYPSYANFGPDAKIMVTGDFSLFTGVNLIVGAGAELQLGSGLVNYGAEIICSTRVAIGEKCWFGPHVVIRDDDEHENDGRVRTAPIDIADNVWVGGRAIILKGVAIGDGAIVASGAVVTKNVPPRTLVGGVPARVLRENVSWHP